MTSGALGDRLSTSTGRTAARTSAALLLLLLLLLPTMTTTTTMTLTTRMHHATKQLNPVKRDTMTSLRLTRSRKAYSQLLQSPTLHQLL